MLTASQKTAFEILNVGFFYMPQFPVKWNLEESQLIINKRPRQWIGFSFTFGLNLALLLSNIYVPFSHFILTHRKGYELFHAVAHIATLLLTLATFILPCFFYTEREAIMGLNQLLTLKYRIYSGHFNSTHFYDLASFVINSCS